VFDVGFIATVAREQAIFCKERPLVDKPLLSKEPGSSGDFPAVTPSRSDGDGRHIHNKILLGLSARESEMLSPKLEFIRLQVQQVLHEPGATLKSAYFPNSGLVSILTVFPDGKVLEVGLVGSEGFVGLPLVAGFRTANTRAIVQIEGSAFRVDAGALREILNRSQELDRRLEQSSQMLTMEVTQLAACNRLHEVNERLARWLLTCADRIHSDSVPITQEFLSHMLGTRRSSVTVAARMLETAGLISNALGRVDIIDRAKLEQASCDCYRMIRTQRAEWLNESV
jgi:CRP-like cAMP-binding protein